MSSSPSPRAARPSEAEVVEPGGSESADPVTQVSAPAGASATLCWIEGIGPAFVETPARPGDSTPETPARPDDSDDGHDWSRWVRHGPGYRVVCCDCGLTHALDIRIGVDGQPEFRFARDDESTELERAGALEDVEQF
jgi:hypothetical protein